MIELVVPVSPEQEDVIADHALNGSELGLLPSERLWMVAQARKVHPTCKVVGADLDIETVTWTLKLEISN